MKTALVSLFSLTLIYSSLSFAGGDLINNGGGIAEKNIMFAYQKLDTYLKLCLSSDFCKVDKTQKQILEQIAAGLAEEKQNPSQIQFASEKNQKGFFIIDGEVKIAKTGSRIGSTIYINTDMLYTKNEMGYYIPMSIGEAAAVLVHELGHHYGDYSHTDLDLVGVRVAMMLQHKTYNTPLLPWSQQISATIINPDVNDSFPDILLYIEDQVIDLSAQFAETVNCPKFIIPIPILPIPDIPVNVKKPLGTLVHNVHWDKISSKDEKTAILSISGDLSHKCKDSKDVNIRSQDYRIEIDFTVNMDENGKWVLNKELLKMEQKRDTWWKIIKFSVR
ncbi:hypothetical protein K2P97_09305 [bacterium]|nr:hypothetical protein [bacterium]